MKKLLIVTLLLASQVYAGQPTGIGNVKAKRVAYDSYTLAQINALQPDTTNQWVGCSDCTQTAVCVSSGSITTTSIGAWVVPIATGTFVGATYSGLPHCR